MPTCLRNSNNIFIAHSWLLIRTLWITSKTWHLSTNIYPQYRQIIPSDSHILTPHAQTLLSFHALIFRLEWSWRHTKMTKYTNTTASLSAVFFIFCWEIPLEKMTQLLNHVPRSLIVWAQPAHFVTFTIYDEIVFNVSRVQKLKFRSNINKVNLLSFISLYVICGLFVRKTLRLFT